MVHHLDAIDVLDNYLIHFDLKLSTSLSIKILYPPLPDDNMLPWEKLLENEKYFPPIQAFPEQPSAADLINFLKSPTLDKEGSGITNLLKDVETMKVNVTKPDLNMHIKTLIEALTDLRNSSSDGRKDCVVAILGEVEAFKSDSTSYGRLIRLEGISNMLQDLKGSFSSPTLDEDGRGNTDLITEVEAIKVRVAEPDFNSDFQNLIEALTDLRESASDGWRDYIEDILRQVEALETDNTTHSRLRWLEGIRNMLLNLEGSFKLYKSVQQGTPLTLGKGFVGATHCEVCAAISNNLSGTPGLHNNISKKLLEEYKVSHVSVTCSNLCQTL